MWPLSEPKNNQALNKLFGAGAAAALSQAAAASAISRFEVIPTVRITKPNERFLANTVASVKNQNVLVQQLLEKDKEKDREYRAEANVLHFEDMSPVRSRSPRESDLYGDETEPSHIPLCPVSSAAVVVGRGHRMYGTNAPIDRPLNSDSEDDVFMLPSEPLRWGYDSEFVQASEDAWRSISPTRSKQLQQQPQTTAPEPTKKRKSATADKKKKKKDEAKSGSGKKNKHKKKESSKSKKHKNKKRRKKETAEREAGAPP
eukprot:gnl/Spiro4/1415_TR758_c0_g1_i1.p1 gnl/Spiro4/1415_TR758_c0_g1~~gnl/Spiro4/1415_TR758_c0_g1_i1.p1  ORF type:complete len:259 (-),score=35.29 gnl/Spiro4/1415_TR758_c0_g1_i1:109-885(-)